MKIIEANGRTVEEAIEMAARELGIGIDDMEYEVVEAGSKGFLGLLGTPSHIKAWAKESCSCSCTCAHEEVAPVELPAEPVQVSAPAAEPIIAKASATVSCAVSKDESPEPGNEDEFVKALMNVLVDVLKAMNLDAKPELKSSSSEEVEINIAGEDVAILIGKHGQTLDALQYLIGIAASNVVHSERRVTLDAEGYRERRKQMLERKAREYADAVRAQGREAVLDPQPARDRRIIHMTLADDPYVYTYSEGERDDRHVVISPKK